MMEILLRFTTPDGSYDVTEEDGIFTFRTPAGTEEYYGCFDEAAQEFDRALEDARREGRCLVVVEDLKGMPPYFAEEQHSDSEEVKCKTSDEPARTLPKAPAEREGGDKMAEILRRFFSKKGRHEVVYQGGEYFYCVICDGKVTESVCYGNFESAECRFYNELNEAHRAGLQPTIDEDFCDEVQHVDIEDAAYETLADTALALANERAAAPVEKKPKTSPEVLENPHYAAQRVQPIDLIETLGSSEFVGFLRGNIIKYTARAGKKSGEPAKKEARKALWYALRWYIEVGGSRDDVTAVLNEMEW